MTSIKKLFIHLFIAVCCLPLSTQLAAQVVKPYYHFNNLTAADGLLSNNVNCVYKDTRGFLWIGTDRGLQRYNGSTFLNFRHFNKDSNSINNEYVSFVKEDRQHNIWIGSFGGVSSFNYQNGKLANFTRGYKNGNEISLGEVLCFYEDSKGRKWLGTYGEGLFLFDEKKQAFYYQYYKNTPVNQGFFDFIQGIEENQGGELVLGTKDGFTIIDVAGNCEHISVPAPADKKTIYLPCAVLPLLKDHPGELWTSSGFNGIFKYDRGLKKWTHYGLEKPEYAGGMSAVYNWNKNEWLISFASHMFFFNHRTGVFTRTFAREMDIAVGKIFADGNGNIWIASGNNGLFSLNTDTQLFSSIHDIPGWGVDQLLYYDGGQGTLYSMNAYDSRIRYLDAIENIVRTDRLPGAVNYHHVINNFIADNNILYIARWGGMCRYNLDTGQFDSIIYRSGSFNSQKEAFYAVCKSADNIYFAGGWGTGGPYMYNKLTGKVTDLALLPAKDTITHVHSYSLVFKDHILYTGTTKADAIYCYNENTGKRYVITVPADYTSGKSVIMQSLCIDKKDQLWCGAGKNGIYVFDITAQQWVKHIDRENGYFPGSSSQLVCDEDGNVWCNSNEGLFCFNTGNFNFKNYKISDGLLGEGEGGYLAVLSDHRLAYNNIDGKDGSFGIINTKPFDKSVQIIPINITDLKVLGNPFLTDTLLDNVQQVILPPNHNAFSLNYAGVHITEGKSLLYTYLLEGAENKWHDAGSSQSLSYLNLAPGKYTLHIKCKSRDEKIISKERLLYITLLPAWYQAWWFKVLLVLVLSGILFLIIKYYLSEQIKKQQALLEAERKLTEERNRIAADMHDDVGAGLSRIRYITASMKEKQAMDDSDIDKIVSLSDESVEKMNEIIWALNQGNQQLSELIYHIRSQCAEMVNNAGIEFTCNMPDEIPNKTMNWKQNRNIYLLAKEAVNNAVKHADAKNIAVNFIINHALQITIKDDGKGFDKTAVRKESNGLVNYNKRVKTLEGTYNITSSPETGTIINFILPIIL